MREKSLVNLKSMRSLSAFLSHSLVTVCSPGSSHLVRLIPRTRVAQAQHEAWNIVSCPKSVHVTARHVMRHILDERHTFTWHVPLFPFDSDTTYFYFFIFPYDPLPGEQQPCAELRQLSVGSLARTPNLYRLWAQASCRKQASH